VIDLGAVEEGLRAQALGYPETSEEFPWGERVVKVRGKVFVFLSRSQDGLNLTVKLPVSQEMARLFDCCRPAGYGLGRSGWITCRLLPDTAFDTDLLRDWLDESYRAVAPRRLVAGLSRS
jgi:predicted DNA-binding protein (MmcQ/YjbR family)